MHPDARAFIATIIEQPLDDTPRLVYADWLEENGEEKTAKFIRGSHKFDAFFRDIVSVQSDWNATDENRSEIMRVVDSFLEVLDNKCESICDHNFAIENNITFCLYKDTDFNTMSNFQTVSIVMFETGFPSVLYCDTESLREHGHRYVDKFPIRWISLTDKAPDEWNGATDTSGNALFNHGEPQFTWWRESSLMQECDLPDEIFSLLENGKLMVDSGQAAPYPVDPDDPDDDGSYCIIRRVYRTKCAALTDVSFACIDMSRIKAGLPPLRTRLDNEPK